jgi:tetratricopeptide (TPR) repeat protein
MGMAMNRSRHVLQDDTILLRWLRYVVAPLAVPLVLTLTIDSRAFSEYSPLPPEESVAENVKAVWETGAMNRALEILEQGIQDHPPALKLQKLRGDILSTTRGPRRAVEAYDAVLVKQPTALDIRWAKWSVLIRSGEGTESVAELQHITEVDARDPLAHLLLAQELRKLDRLEESLQWYKKAVSLAPDLLGWRLALARARFDVLDYPGAVADVDYVLQKVPPGSQLELASNNLLSLIYGSSKDRGRRFDPVLTPDVTAGQLKEWSFIRGEAWNLFSTEHFAEAEPLYRKLLALNPKDPTATHSLGLILMQLGKCEEALTIFQKMSDLDPSEEEYADSMFRRGQCLVEMERWEDAFFSFQTLYDSAVEFEEKNKHVILPSGTRVLDKQKLARWLEKVRPHVPELAERMKEASEAANNPAGFPKERVLSEKELAARVLERAKPQDTLDRRTPLMGKDADFSWFQFIIPASKVMRDDFPTGAHEFIPINPGDSFPTTQQEIYLVFRLMSSSYDAVPLAARCFIEVSELTGKDQPIAEDQVIASMSDESGYFTLIAPASGWTPGLYRCGLFAGERTSAYTHVDEIRFRILEPTNQS